MWNLPNEIEWNWKMELHPHVCSVPATIPTQTPQCYNHFLSSKIKRATSNQLSDVVQALK